MNLLLMMPAAIYILLSVFLAQEFASAFAVRPAAALAARPLLRGTQRVQCPCALRLFRRRTDADLSDDLIDLLATREHRADRRVSWRTAQRQNVRAASDHSVFNISLQASTRSDNLFHHFEEIKIKEAGTFHVSLQPSQNKPTAPNMEDYFLSTRPLSRIPRACPAKLGPYQSFRREVSAGRVVDGVTAPSEKLPAIEPRVVGGTFASADLASYMVVVYNPNGNYCSGALLSGRWGITSAHCLMNANFTVGVKTTQVRVDGVRVGVRRVITHPMYATAAREWDYDVTVFELEKEAPPGWRAMVVNTNIQRPRAGAFARVAGYGYKSEGNVALDLLPGRLRQVDLPVVGQKRCAEAYQGIRTISARSQTCAGYLGVGGCDTCQGDSGAPLFRYTGSGELLLLGITSFGIGCARPEFPGVYLRAASVVPWLRSTPAVFRTFSGSAGDWEAEMPSPKGRWRLGNTS